MSRWLVLSSGRQLTSGQDALVLLCSCLLSAIGSRYCDGVSNADSASLLLTALVESSEDAIISENLDGVIESWNKSAERMFGVPCEQAIGAHADIIIPDSERAGARALTERVREGESVLHFQSYRKRESGELVPVSLSLSPIRALDGSITGVSTIARDIGQQLQVEREAFRLAAIVDSSEDAIVSKDLNSIVQTWNGAAERLFGFTADEVIGRSIRMIIPSDRQREEDDVLSTIKSGGVVTHFETIRQRKDGQSIEISLTVSPIKDRHGRIIGASKIARDISAQKALMRELADANRIKDEFLATLSHELRTPLNAVLGYTQMLRTGKITEDRRDHVVGIIERNAQLLSQLVSDVLDVSSIVTGKIRLKPAPIDLLHVARAAADVVRPAIEAKGLTLGLSNDGRPLIARGDADRMQQAIWNLLTNAVKFTPSGGHIEMSLARTEAGAQITVSDTGMGIPKSFLPHLFERFRQLDDGTHREAGGLGLGLSLVRYFVELHGGSVTAESEGEGRGSTFRILLPVNPPVAPDNLL